MSDPVLLNLLNITSLRKRDMRDLSSILLLFRKEFNKFNKSAYTGLVKKLSLLIKGYVKHVFEKCKDNPFTSGCTQI